MIVAAVAFLPEPAPAQDYPTRPIRLIVASSPSGSTDLVARLVARSLSREFARPVVVDNRPGAGSVHALELTANATPDGHTLVAVAASFTINPVLHKKLPFDPARDFAPITQLVTLPHVLIVHPSLPVVTVRELVTYAKSMPNELNFASSGIATSTHLAAELFMHMTGTRMVNVPFRGGAPGLTATIGGQCQVNFATLSTALPSLHSGKVRPLAVTAATRAAAAPDLPTVSEAGVPGYAHSSWIGLMAPARTPASIVARLNREANTAIRQPKATELLSRSGFETTGTTPDAYAALIRAEIRRWIQVATAAGMTSQ